MANQKDVEKPKEGIENFIIKKLEKAHTVDEIRVILVGAGFSKAEIEKGLRNVKETHKTLHQDVAASNNFFPLLKKSHNKESFKINKKVNNKENSKDSKQSSVTSVLYSAEESFDHLKHIGLFAGRIRRKDFIVSILFLFSLFFSIVIIVASFIDALYPESWKLIGKMFANDPNGALFLYIPVLFAPFSLIFLSLVTRRLHDLDLPGILSFFYLGVFVYPFSEYASKGIIVFDIILFILFLFLLSKHGIPETNRYGKSPVSHGSTFTKILNLK